MSRKAIVVGVSLTSLAVCCALAWWQWERFSSAGGTFQNLGYVLQWPLFGLFPAFMFWRLRRLRREAQLQEAQQQVASGPGEQVDSAGVRPAATLPPRVARAPAVREEEDEELAAYNRYLAELNAQEPGGR